MKGSAGDYQSIYTEQPVILAESYGIVDQRNCQFRLFLAMPYLDNEVLLVHFETGPYLLDIGHLKCHFVLSERLDPVGQDQLPQMELVDHLSLLVDLTCHQKLVAFDVLTLL